MRVINDQDDRRYLVLVPLFNIVARVRILRPLVLNEGVPAAYLIIFTDAALDDLGEHIYQLLLLLNHVIRARHERESRRYGLHLDRVLDLAGKLLAPLLHHVLLVDPGKLAYQVCLVEDALVGDDVREEVLFLEVVSLAVERQ